MPRIISWFFVLLLALLPAQAWGQAVPRVAVEGYVLDAATGDSLPGANVFVDGATLGAATGVGGHFRIENIPAVSVKLVASMIGYRRQVYEIDLAEGVPAQIIFKLQSEVHVVSGVTITAERDEEWKRNLERFKKLFIGTMDFADRVEILNPEVLDFSYENGRLYAGARAPLHIINGGLGYRLVYYLDTLRGNIRQSFYRGTSQFSELAPESADEARQWQMNRRKAYRGSLRHFLSALARDELSEAGFIAQRDPVPGRRSHKVQYGVRDTLVDPGPRPFEYILTVSDILTVGFDESELSGYTAYRREIGYHPQPWDDFWVEFSMQYSWLVVEGGTATFTARGFLYDSYVTRLGYWAWEEKIAMLLPRDYVYVPGPEGDGEPWWKFW